MISALATYIFPSGRVLKLVKNSVNVTNSTNPHQRVCKLPGRPSMTPFYFSKKQYKYRYLKQSKIKSFMSKKLSQISVSNFNKLYW